MIPAPTSFATLPAQTGPLRVVLVGAGAMGRMWMQTIDASPDAELVGVVDLDTDFAATSLTLAGLDATAYVIGTNVTEVAARTQAQAVINVTVPGAHLSVGTEALNAGLAVLSEKPVAPTVRDALKLAEVARESGQLLMVSQSRRYLGGLSRLREHVNQLGEIGFASTQFFRAPHFGGFREEMDHVLLVDMAIHAFDAARFVLDQDPVAVYCRESNPGWSWFADGAAATAIFEMSGGATYTYTGSWCSDGFETSWNGAWRISGAQGTALWSGEGDPTVEFADGVALEPVQVDDGPEEIAGALAEFVSALRTGAWPSGEVHSNILSLAMVEAATRSAELSRRVTIDEVIEAALND
ncbi:Gfo/Idh/MocA family protein [Microbacterium sp. BH-3-3-3]|uniref:Gfo/Idh/MocA family protein n=1 Tax=Microbacterium sp. BH-3-3-3 TaxID=1906742 RepID=UPI00089287A2|nr:Gfo/Idh/MocA family oxidoreductase [Microbacterium sp. BH-3-3-3]AOX44901.1 oxidoreductase [Microbacterium sp. BH-3-3-3]